MPRSLPVICIAIALGSGGYAADVDYLRDVKPLLAEKCVSCHGPLKQEAGLRLDAAHLIRKGSDSGPVAIAVSPADSLIIQRISADSADERMPPEGEGAPLKPEQIAAFERWIAADLPAPANEPVLESPKDHWAYQRITRPDVPAAPDDREVNPIDAFLNSKRLSAGVTPLGPADAPTLLRRLHLDLVGLPPTVDELQSFAADNSEAAYRREVDRLLATPQYGERWARHWMDVWRYSDWDGFKEELRGSQRHIWRWRDWIVESLNADKGYDRMVEEMLAGDELAPSDPNVVRATGYLARSYHFKNRNIWMDAAVEHTAKAFLGMTLACARCHDHKYDPIAQPEYYAFRAIFEPYNVRTDPVDGQFDLGKNGLARVYDAYPDRMTYLYVSGNEKQPDTENPLSPAVPTAIELAYDAAPVTFPREVYFPALAPDYERRVMARAEAAVRVARKQVKKSKPNADTPSDSERRRLALALEKAEAELESLKARYAADKAKYCLADSPASEEEIEELARSAASAQRRHEFAKARLTVLNRERLLAKAEAAARGGDAKKQNVVNRSRRALGTAKKQSGDAEKALTKTDANYTPAGEVYPETSTGRRLALARWITNPGNPLTARVAVNHIWMRHFGEPLVAEVFDFGLRSPRPVHAELLDWLASELIDSSWSMKHIHRLIVTSQAYRLASAGDLAAESENRRVDPDNRLLWRANARRLDAEVIRDSQLFIAGKLDMTLGGPEIDVRQGETVPRRSIYFGHAYEKQMTMLLTFDAPSPTECYRRSPSIIPQQALAMSNSALGVSLSRELAGKLWKEVGDGDGTETRFIDQAFQTVLSRSPTEDERQRCREFLPEQARQLAHDKQLSSFGGAVKASIPPAADPDQRARENLVHVLMNHNDFVTVR